MTYDVVYAAFLSKVLEDEWAHWEWEEVQQDLRQLLESALTWFKFPSTSFDRNDEGFLGELTDQEIQVISTYMKVEWLNRTILSWENLRPLYEERDFSPANLLRQFNDTLEREQKRAAKLEASYYRSVNKKPFDFSRLAR